MTKLRLLAVAALIAARAAAQQPGNIPAGSPLGGQVIVPAQTVPDPVVQARRAQRTDAQRRADALRDAQAPSVAAPEDLARPPQASVDVNAPEDTRQRTTLGPAFRSGIRTPWQP